MLLKICGLCVLGFLGSATLSAQYVPISAKMHQVVVIAYNGTTTTHVQDGVFYRSSTGNELRRWTSRDGKAMSGEAGFGGLTDKEHGVFYKIDYEGRRAYQQPQVGFTTPHSSDIQTTENHEETVDGINCAQMPVLMVASGKSTVPIGTDCWSTNYSLELARDISIRGAGGKVTHTTFTLQEIRLGVEPDTKLFDLSNFIIYRPDSATNPR